MNLGSSKMPLSAPWLEDLTTGLPPLREARHCRSLQSGFAGDVGLNFVYLGISQKGVVGAQ